MIELVLAFFFVSMMKMRRGWVAAFTLGSVALVTLYALIGLHPSVGWVTVREGLFLASLNIFFASVYFEVISPNRDKVPSFVTSSLAIFAGIIATFTLNAFFHIGYVDYLYFAGSSGLLLLIIFNWFYYEIVVLKSFHTQVLEVTKNVPMPDSMRKALEGEEND